MYQACVLVERVPLLLLPLLRCRQTVVLASPTPRGVHESASAGGPRSSWCPPAAVGGAGWDGGGGGDGGVGAARAPSDGPEAPLLLLLLLTTRRTRMMT